MSDAKPVEQRPWAEFRQDPRFTEGERRLVNDWLWGMGGSFYLALMVAIMRADDVNRERLRRGFPDDVAAWIAWSQGDLARRLKEYYPDLYR